MMAHFNIPGERFGKLILLAEASRPTQARRWFVRCDCGKEKIVYQQNLRSGGTTSCGSCHVRKPNLKHGLSKSPLYAVWCHMRSNCHNKNSPDYVYNGARGTTVCDEWDRDFRPFHEWSLKTGYKVGLSLSIIDTNGNYGPDNCEWRTSTERTRKGRSTKLNIATVLAIIDEKNAGISASDLSKRYNITASHVHSIVSGRKWKGVQ